MPTAPSQAARFADVLLAVVTRLRSQLSLDDTRVKLVKGGGYELPFVAEAHVRVRGVRGSYFGDHGGGRYGMPVTRILAVDVFTRNSIDAAGEDEFALTEAGAGHYDREEAVADALTLWTPLTTGLTPKPLTVEPLHPAESVNDADAPEPRRFEGYLTSTIHFDAKYVAKLLN